MSAAETPSLTRQPKLALAPSNIRSTLQDVSMFDLLRSETVQQVAGSFDQPFWAVDVLRATQAYPAIWHANLALAAVHDTAKTSGNSDASHRSTRERYILKHYTASINDLIAITRQGSLSTANQEAVLLASMLLTALCCQRGDINQALIHARNGIQLFHQWRFWEQTHFSGSPRGCILNAASIATIMDHFELQFVNRLTHITIPCRGIPGIPPRCSETPFDSVTSAYFELQPLISSLMGLWQHAHLGVSEGSPQPARELRYAHQLESEAWKVKFDTFIHSSQLKETDLEGILILQLLWSGLDVCLKANIYEGETAFDMFQPSFEYMVTRAEQLREMLSKKTSTQNTDTPPLFSFSMSISEMLFWSGNGCRDGPTRRRIIDLLRTWPQSDGIWDPRLLAAITEASMNLEESGWSQDEASKPAGCVCVAGVTICNDHRVNGHSVEFLPDGRAKVVLKTVADIKANTSGYEVILSW